MTFRFAFKEGFMRGATWSIYGATGYTIYDSVRPDIKFDCILLDDGGRGVVVYNRNNYYTIKPKCAVSHKKEFNGKYSDKDKILFTVNDILSNGISNRYIKYTREIDEIEHFVMMNTMRKENDGVAVKLSICGFEFDYTVRAK